MPVLLHGVRPDSPALSWIGPTDGILVDDGMPVEAGRTVLEVGIVNNMPDSALQATERQFIGLLAAAAGDRTVRVKLFSLPSVARGEAAAAHIQAAYGSLADIARSPLDALIVTGCEPKLPSLADESYWTDLTRLIDWAEHNTTSTLWSCLAAHAAVLHLDGIARNRLPRKRLGVYRCEALVDHPLLAGVPDPLEMSHSRWNDLHEADLATHGYAVLTRSPEAGVNLFAKQWRSLFVFFQGHPEYDVDSIAREYRRDVARYLRAERPDYPGLPAHYFDADTTVALEAFQTLALADRMALALRDLPRKLVLRPGLRETWQSTVIPVFRNWLDLLADGRR